MKSENIKQAISYAEMAKGNAYTKAEEYKLLLHLAKRLSTIDTHRCNGTRYNDENGDESYLRAKQAVYAKLDEILLPHGMDYYHQSDPRGTSLYISNERSLNSSNYNNGLAIY
jgi:hypothetical protein